MTYAGSGLSTARTAAAAARDASAEALARSGRARADLAIVFTSGEFTDQGTAFVPVIRRVTGARVVGCSGAGVLTEQREVEGEPAIAVLTIADERLVATPLLIESLDTAGVEIGAEIARRVEATVAEGGSLMILPDVQGLDPRPLLAGLHEALDFVPVTGAVAAGAPSFEVYDEGTVTGALVGLAFAGPPPLIGVAQGCMPIGEPFVVTRAERNVVHEIAGRPAGAVLQDAIVTVDDYRQRIARAGIFAGLAMDPAKSPLERGDFLVRNLLGLDRASGAVAVAESVRVGQTIQFQIRDARSSREDLVATLAGLVGRLEGRQPAFGCYFNCAGRGHGLFGTPDHDVTLIRETLGDFPLVGFFGNGEFAPIARRNFFHTYTGALVLFPA